MLEALAFYHELIALYCRHVPITLARIYVAINEEITVNMMKPVELM